MQAIQNVHTTCSKNDRVSSIISFHSVSSCFHHLSTVFSCSFSDIIHTHAITHQPNTDVCRL